MYASMPSLDRKSSFKKPPKIGTKPIYTVQMVVYVPHPHPPAAPLSSPARHPTDESLNNSGGVWHNWIIHSGMSPTFIQI